MNKTDVRREGIERCAAPGSAVPHPCGAADRTAEGGSDVELSLKTLKDRFIQHPERHPELAWERVEARLQAKPEALEALRWMEETGGEPDVIGTEGERLLFADCSGETPAGRVSLCYDEAARVRRKKNPPADSAEAQAGRHGIALLTEEQYRRLQSLGEFDCKSSSWIATPPEIRALGGALFCERRYGAVFTFHNGADSYYSVRGWRGLLSV
ncbi:MAG: DUF4256 domain-containing protein [Oscillospiraceae bacterium]|nr:DUF4256 domain-containing protein [Oscillospiraceae bacterium]